VDTSVTPKRSTGTGGPAIAGAMDAVTHPLQPGEVMVLGPIGDGATGASIAGQAGAAGAIGGGNGVNGGTGRRMATSSTATG
jgi:hypothetical protein